MRAVTVTSVASLLAAGSVWAQAPAPQEVNAPAYEVTNGVTINTINVSGQGRVARDTVLSFAEVNIGDQLDPTLLNIVYKRLDETRLFSQIDVAFHPDTGALDIEVLENPIINVIAFEGNDAIDDDGLRQEISLRPRQVLTRDKVQQDVERLRQVYRRSGHYAVEIDPQVIERDQNRLDLVFDIIEGEKSTISKITFVGNEAKSDAALAEVIQSEESRWYKLLGANDTFDPDRISFDETLLRRYYLANGYPQFSVRHQMAKMDENGQFELVFVIDEGDAFTFDDVTIDNKLRDLDLDKVRPLMTTASGELYDADAIETSIEAMTEEAGNQQYGFVDIRPNITLDEDTKTVDLTYLINESQKIFVERIDIEGNIRTLDEVIRREFLLAEGDPYNLSRLKTSERQVRNLDYFQTVEVDVKRGSRPDLAEIDVKVEEKSTGELSLGAGFSTTDGALADFRITERNLLGTGRRLSLGATVSGITQEAELSYTEPYFLDRDVTAGIDAFSRTRDLRDESSYEQKNEGGGFRLGYRLGKNLNHLLQYRLDNNEIRNVEFDASRFIREQEGERLTSEISHRLTYDTRDSRIMPTEGINASISNGFAGLGGEAKYLSTVVRGQVFYPFFDRDVVVSALGEVGYIVGLFDEDIRINERFFIGGDSLRGFETAGIGPRDILTRDSLGGERYARTSFEVAFPLGLPDDLGVKGHFFTDAGTLGRVDYDDPLIANDESIRASTGFGVSWQSPFGPVRADFAVPWMKEDYDEEQKFKFSFGTLF